ncbi:MAG: S8 family serine peptidase [Pseudomonadota bacterium]
MYRFFVLAFALLMVPVACAQTSQPELPLGDAATFETDRHIIVTTRSDDDRDPTLKGQELAAQYGLQLAAAWPLVSLDVMCFVFRVPGDPGEAANDISAEGDVVVAYPLQSFGTLLLPGYDDPLFKLQDGLQAMQVASIHSHTKGAGVKVALIDTGVAQDHVDLQGQDVTARNFVSRAALDDNMEQHGTALAAIIAADADNGDGMVGIAPSVQLLALRACWEPAADGAGRCNTFSLARALNFAIVNEVDVINLSLTGPEDPILGDLIKTALSRGIAVVAAASSETEGGLVDAIPDVILAANTPTTGGHVLAPGTEVLSAKPVNDFDFYSGSSVSAAHVTAAASLLRSYEPRATVRDLAAALMEASAQGTAPVNLCKAFRQMKPAETFC